MASLTIQQAFDLALQHHHAGRLPEAEQLYRQVLAQQPDHSAATHHLGVIAHQVGRNDIAADLIRRSITLNPNAPEAYSNLGNVLKEQGQVDRAIDAYHHAIGLKPDYAEAHNNLGNALRDNGQIDQAISAYHHAIAQRPNYAEAHNNLGNALKDKGQLDDAIAAYRQAIALKPNYAIAHSNLGNVLKDKGQFDEAVTAFRQAIALQPNYAEGHNNFGNALKTEGQLDEAIAAYRQAIALKPDYADAHYNLGNALRDKGQLDEAIVACRRAITLRPDLSQAHDTLGNALKDTGQLDDAITAYRQAITVKPAYTEAHSNLVYAMYFHPAYDAKAFAEEHRRWNQQHAEPLRHFIQPHTNDPNPDRRLRIGYISPNFRQHTNGLAMLPLLKAHDHTHFEIFCYSDVRHPDSITEQCQSAVDQWRSVVGLTDEHVAELVRKDQIDIFVDLVSHMGGNRLLAFARKPAPVQVTFLGHQGTTGLTTIDYRISDRHIDPPGPDDAHYTEKIIRLPDYYLIFQPPADSPEVTEPPASQQGAVTFGSLNNFCKITPQVLQLWSRILTELPQSRLILRCPAGETQQRVLSFFAQRGIDSKRLILSSKWLGTREYLELHQEMDIYLDTFPHAGHTTSMDALWMGVPLITLKGQTAVGRGGVFLLANLGLEELIAQTEQEYLEKAVELAGDLPRLRELRSTLRQRMERSPLMDVPKYARNIESAYRQMWHTWCQTISSQTELSPLGIQHTLNLASQHLQAGRNDVAVDLIRRAIAISPNYAEAHNDLGSALIVKGELHEAIAAFRQAIKLKPSYANAHYNLGNALRDKGQFEGAIAAYRQAITLQPQDAEAHGDLGNALMSDGQLDNAIAEFHQAIALRPSYAQAHNNLGNALRDKGQLDEAVAIYRRAIALQPDLPEAHYNLGNALKDGGELDEAIAAWRRAIALKPNYTQAHSNLVYTLYFHPAYDAKAFAEEHRHWNLQHAEPLKKFIQSFANDRNPDRRLRIGYISPNFRQHPIGSAMLPLLKAHDHTHFEIFCYSDVRHPDSITDQCRNAVDQWRSVVGLTDEQVAELVRKDQIDILVDLVSHMGSNRLLTFARKPAPVQVTFLGHQGTTGLTTMDYRISDPYVDPPGPNDSHYTEKIIRLPDCYLVFQPPANSPEVKEPPASRPGAVTFGSLNNFCKITPQVLQLWSRILTELPQSRLILRCPAGETQQRVLSFFAQRGIDSTRLSLSLKWLGAREYLELHDEIDIYLDTFPHAGHTTSMDALWMGVPLITLKGQTAVGRGGVFLLANLGLEELIAQTEQEYLEKAVKLAGDLPRLRELRSTLRQRMERSPLMDAPKYARNIESVYRQMWHTCCQSVFAVN